MYSTPSYNRKFVSLSAEIIPFGTDVYVNPVNHPQRELRNQFTRLFIHNRNYRIGELDWRITTGTRNMLPEYRDFWRNISCIETELVLNITNISIKQPKISPCSYSTTVLDTNVSLHHEFLFHWGNPTRYHRWENFFL